MCRSGDTVSSVCCVCELRCASVYNCFHIPLSALFPLFHTLHATVLTNLVHNLDFRPDYLSLKAIRGLYPDVPIMALTATANLNVVEDVMTIMKMVCWTGLCCGLHCLIYSVCYVLGVHRAVLYCSIFTISLRCAMWLCYGGVISPVSQCSSVRVTLSVFFFCVCSTTIHNCGFVQRDPFKHSQSFNRPNIEYTVKKKTSKTLTEEIPNIIKARIRLSGIIYCLSKNDTEKVSTVLQEKIPELRNKVTFYHAGVDAEQRESRQRAWCKGDIRVIVATIAFGMGINKPGKSSCSTTVYCCVTSDIVTYFILS